MNPVRAQELFDEADRLRCLLVQAKCAGDDGSAFVWSRLLSSAASDWLQEVGEK